MASSMKSAAAEGGARPEEEIPAETLAVIAAAATVFLGRNLRILSAQSQPSPRESVSRWSRQGRASVGASHNPRSKR